jgi:hypothetical protein
MVTGIRRLAVVAAVVTVALTSAAPVGAWPDLAEADGGGAVQPGMRRQQPSSGDAAPAPIRARADGHRREIRLEPTASGSDAGGVDLTALALLAGVCAACAAIGAAVTTRTRHRVAQA